MPEAAPTPNDAAFVHMLLASSPKTLRPLARSERGRDGALQTLLRLCGDSTGGRREARATLCRVWGLHGVHGEPHLLDALQAAGFGRLATALPDTERWLLRPRLEKAVTALGRDQPFDYARLYNDALYFGPRVVRQWKAQLAPPPEHPLSCGSIGEKERT